MSESLKSDLRKVQVLALEVVVEALQEECDALRADAERWRFATSDYAEEHTDIAVCKAFAAVFGVDANDVVDAAIDAARAAKEQSNG